MPLAVAASILVAALGKLPPSLLLDKLPEHLVRDWLRDLEAPARVVPMIAAAVPLPTSAESRLRQAAEHCGWRQPPTVWLASIVVIAAVPSLAHSPDLLHRVRTTLRLLEPAAPANQRAPRKEDRPEDINAADSASTAAEPTDLSFNALSPRASETVTSKRKFELPLPAAPQGESSNWRPGAPEAQPLQPSELSPSSQTGPGHLPGEATEFAGLYFLLHVLRRLSIAAALDACPALAEAQLPVHVLLQLAAGSGVPIFDPILAPVGMIHSPFSLDAQTLAALPSAGLPNNLTPAALPAEGSAVLRLWAHAVRRWCWVNARISVGAIIRRKGHVWATRAELDVILPMNGADVRIRRAGLDLDPLWLPWFGDYGRVFRFHYVHGTSLGEPD
jgi:hypothetical protein